MLSLLPDSIYLKKKKKLAKENSFSIPFWSMRILKGKKKSANFASFTAQGSLSQ